MKHTTYTALKERQTDLLGRIMILQAATPMTRAEFERDTLAEAYDELATLIRSYDPPAEVAEMATPDDIIDPKNIELFLGGVILAKAVVMTTRVLDAWVEMAAQAIDGPVPPSIDAARKRMLSARKVTARRDLERSVRIIEVSMQLFAEDVLHSNERKQQILHTATNCFETACKAARGVGVSQRYIDTLKKRVDEMEGGASND